MFIAPTQYWISEKFKKSKLIRKRIDVDRGRSSTEQKKSKLIEIKNLMSNTGMVSTEQKEVETIELQMLDQYITANN